MILGMNELEEQEIFLCWRDYKRKEKIARSMSAEGEMKSMVLLEIADCPARKKYQVFFSWMFDWHRNNVCTTLDIYYEDDGRGLDRSLTICVRKQFIDCQKSSTYILRDGQIDVLVSSQQLKDISTRLKRQLEESYRKEKQK